MLPTCIVKDPIYLRHATKEAREVPARYEVIDRATRLFELKTLEPKKATEEHLRLCHTQQYID